MSPRGLSSPRLMALAMIAVLASSAATAQTLKAEDAIKLRRSAFALQGYYFSQLKPMISGQQPFDAALARRLTSRIETLSQMPPEFFPAGSDKGETKAKAEIWSDSQDFTTKQQKSIADVAKLSAAAQAGDTDSFKARYLDAASSCKDCHESYRQR